MNGMMNPMNIMLNIARNGGNPMIIAQQMAQSNPQMANAMRLISGKNSQQLATIAQNMAAQRGLSVDEIARNLGLR